MPPDGGDVAATSAASERRRSPLHGRRTGKPLSAHQQDLLRTVLPRLAVDLSAPIDVAALFPFAVRDVWLEVGFGGAEHLLATARREPQVGLIGCEPFLNGLVRAVADIETQTMANIRLHGSDAGALIARLPEASLGRVFVLYPDPWPKRRQRKRRFLSDEMLVALARVMKPGAELRFATDIDDYCGWVLARLARSPDFVWTAACARDWQHPWRDWASTRYEQKAVAAGRRPCYVTAIRR